MFCVKCGTRIPEESNFCPNCGAEVKKSSSVEDSMNSPLMVSEPVPQMQSQPVPQVPNELASQIPGEQSPQLMNDHIVATVPQEEVKKKKTTVIVAFVLAVVVLVVMLIMVIILFTNRDKATQKKEEETLHVTNEDTVADTQEEEPVILDEIDTNAEGETEEESVVETEETKFISMIRALNESDASLEKIDVYEDNYEPEDRKSSYQWNPELFYSLEDISPDSYEDGLINGYMIEKKQLLNADTNNLMEYEIYRNLETDTVNKIVSIEYKEDILEITDYYYTDNGKVNFVFVREDTNYVPSYAIPSKSGRRYYYNKDTLVKWRIVEDGEQKNFVAGKEEKERGGNSGKVILYKDLSEEKQTNYNKTEKKMLNAAYNTYKIALDAQGLSNIIGYVTDTSGQPLNGATIHLYSEDYETEVYSCNVDTEGKYAIVIPSQERGYRIEITKEGYVTTVLYDIQLNKQLIGVYQETICLVEDNMNTDCNTQLVVCDAFNRAYDYEGMLRIDNATIRIRKGVNNKYGEISGNAKTDSDGIVYLLLKPGMYTVEVSKPGYAVTYYTITVVQNNMMITINTTPILNDGEIRIVLTWEDTPRDLDSHLFTPYDSTSGDTTYHIWYGNSWDNNANNLDVDDVDGYGPETMTINNLGNGLYKYYVADYTNCSNGYTDSEEMSYSNATVDVYSADGLVQTFHVPTNRPGVIWEVFEIRNKTVVPIQRYYNNLDNKTWWNNEK
ncbi:zinc-ribbon domain-containing protein [Anaerosporobacter mobilis DSM 15930]|jgi:hypothetical protein|uniref:Zinc-ribbon domain-containing protein n=1 Tax=Anaerosporobacter mobilis DSM 15930 TaxID=1120996 RepID=A0A1M7IIG1_9FIRM|nr:carboxypeptidase regulatory-like domain-containing protein [Anaerosporobacter mobilis]SHM40554.1 zinc-ribbon domain-containing protein [Anaerosporobacter mobilis DSM 15930]